MNNSKNKTKLILIIGSIILVLLALFATTYAAFFDEQVAENPENYSTGVLSIEAKSKSDVISLDDVLPMSDEDGANTDPYVFTIKNNGNVDYKFDIKLLSTSNSNNIDTQYIKLKVDDDSVVTLSSLTNSVIKSNITLEAKESIDITLRVWFDEDTPNSQIDKTFTSKIVIDGQAIYTESNYDALDGAALQIYEKFNKTGTVTEGDNTTVDDVDTVNQLIKDPLGNIRYYGADPNNYIYFNCSDYSNQSSSTCETWRIIGVVDGKLKLIRSESIGTYAWDTNAWTINGGVGINEWSQADVMKLLNPGYESETIGGSLYWNSVAGNCYNGVSNSTTTCDFTIENSQNGKHQGIKNDITRNMIATSTYYNGGYRNSAIYLMPMLQKERGTTVISNPSDGIIRTTSWYGRISIAYPSDYGYASELGTNKCVSLLSSYNDSNCKDSNWLLNILTANQTNDSYFITPNSSNGYNLFCLLKSGVVSRYCNVYEAEEIIPVLYLSSEITIDMSHTGSDTDPYVINNN